MSDHLKLTSTVIWFAILSGLFVVLVVAGGGFAALMGEFQVRSLPLMLVGVIPLAVAMTTRVLLLPTTKGDQAFLSLFIISLALCEGPGFVAMFVFPDHFTTERAFAFIGSVVGVALLCPLTLSPGQRS